MSSSGIDYALHEKSKIKLMASNELLSKYPEALVTFLESQVEFIWPQRDINVVANNVLNNRVYVSACTNQGVLQGLKYLLSQNATQFVRVIPSRLAIEQVPNIVIEFLESKLDLTDCNAPKNTAFGKFFLPYYV